MLQDARPALSTYIYAFDGLRNIAAMLVLLGHVRGKLYIDYIQAREIGGLWTWAISTGIGVDLFFVLSGLLITSILLDIRDRGGSMLAFWMRRALRIMPLYMLYVAVVLAVTLSGVSEPMTTYALTPVGWILVTLCMANVALMLHGQAAIEVTILWSIAVEEQFYLMWPWCVRTIQRAELHRLALAAIPVAMVARWANAEFAPNSDAFYIMVFTRMDGLMIGALMAMGRKFWPRWPEFQSKVVRFGLVPALVYVAYVLQKPFYHEVDIAPWHIGIYYTTVAIAWAVVLMWALEGGRVVELLLENRVSVFLGRISYGVYMWQCLCIGVVIHFTEDLGLALGPRTYLTLGLSVVATIVVSTISYYGFERYFTRLKHRFPYFDQQEPS